MHLVGFVIRMVLIICNYFLSDEFHVICQISVSQTFFGRETFWLRKINKEPHIIAHVNAVSGL